MAVRPHLLAGGSPGPAVGCLEYLPLVPPCRARPFQFAQEVSACYVTSHMPYRPLDESVREQVRQLIDQGLSDGDVARQTGVSRMTVARMRQRLSRSTVPPQPATDTAAALPAFPPPEPAEPPPSQLLPAREEPERPAPAAPSDGEWVDRLLAVLEADPKRLARLRRVAVGELPQVPARPRGPRKTYAWYLPAELGDAVLEKAKAEGVAPSAVAERILLLARRMGWL